MVNRLLSGGYVFLLDVVDSEELREEVWSDPVLLSALSKYRDSAGSIPRATLWATGEAG
jgi:hypothetical protein